ncbi:MULTISPECIES: DUF4199 domain-containing protein [Arcicella]|uniref:DUF4199 domain-containing protein n=1 Tax=Arcicella aquatica TaxID=217141 RepID=A0ABU5QPI3_9BACT|nr:MULTISPECIES: DUF4199 domain-containing protein [Arcicella]MDR6563010.1 hypothetical protein [Arcicella sp. BE51]MDR6813094.1 hypothetical protein [Arcicella sp. BE140]MDR6824408.1 hypothetical protein [Arcicella sp. BE139]MEA5258685.1 DUF4199 domain-containing protein [Arcicella aquatica]
MESQTTTTRIALKWGIIAGIISIILSVATQLLGLKNSQDVSTGFFLFLIGLAFTCLIQVLAMNDYKSQNNGFMSYGEGLGIGLLSGVIWGVVSGGFNILYLKYIDNSEMIKQANLMRQKMEEQGATDAQMEVNEKIISYATDPSIGFIITVIAGFIGGLIVALIISAILKKEKSIFE